MKRLNNLFVPMGIAFGLALVLSQPTTAGSVSGNQAANAEPVASATRFAEYRDAPVSPN
jgi:hypothetical protein